MNQRLETTVLIVGAGPVGMTLAMDLASRGVEVLVVERRARTEPSNARCNTVAARTMEIFRRLKVADKVRASGLPDDYRCDVVWTTRANGHEIARLPLASRATRFTDRGVADAGWPTPEPVHRASQLFFDSVLRDHAMAEFGIGFINEADACDYVQDADGVSATIRPPTGGEPYRIRCRYLIGCDGGRSVIRKRMGAKFIGDTEIYRSCTRLIRAPWMREHIQGSPGWITWYLGPGPVGALVAINGVDLWLTHVMAPGEAQFDRIAGEEALRTMLQLPPELRYEVLHREDWTARRLLADRFRDRRVFLCGDSAHIWVPFAGHGMNAGIADAANLAWLLAAVVNGWGAPALLDCYEAERQPVTDQVSHYAMNKAMEYVNGSLRNAAPAELDWDNDAGRAVRAALGERLLDINTAQFACSGLNFGYFYDNSPIIAYDGEAHPSYDLGSYTPSTVPGCRLPHFWTPEHSSLYDLLGPDYTLLRFDRSVNAERLLVAAHERGVPLQLLDLDNPQPLVYRHKLTLARPDQHVAWRGDQVPENPMKLIDLIRGARADIRAAR